MCIYWHNNRFTIQKRFMQRQKLPWDECKYPNNMISNSPAAEIVPSIERGPQRLNEIDEEGGGNLSRRWCVKNTILFFFFFPFGIVLKSKSYCTASKRVAYFQGREATTLWMGAAVRSSVLRKNWDSWTTWRRKLKNPCRQTIVTFRKFSLAPCSLTFYLRN